MLLKSTWSKALFLSAMLALVVSGSVFAQEVTTKKVGAWRESCARCQKDKTPAAKPTVNKCNEFIFDSTSSYDPNNKKITVDWDFGDGATSTDPVVKHIYERSGEYTVTLKVTNNTGVTCDTDVTTQKVLVNTPPVADFTSPDGVCLGQDVSFDASSTTGNMANGMTYSWDFGDGTKETGAMVRHTYEKSGTYQVRLFVNDNANTSCSTDSIVKTVSVGSAPVADAGRDKELCLSGSQSMNVNFDGSGSYGAGPLTYDWNFGDGSSGTGVRVSHEYAKPGTYDATLTVRNEGISGCNMASDDVKVSLFKGPSVNAGDDAAACVGESVSFNGSGVSGSGSDLKYRWDFGDGESAEGATATHNYTKGGVYRAVLYVDDGTGSRCSTASDVREVVVGAPPVARLIGPDTACAGEKVMFDASDSSGDGRLKYAWDFGDGTTENGGSKVYHVYEKGGQYNVRVMVERCSRCEGIPENAPCSTDSASTTIKVNSAPVADAGPNTVCCAGKESVFDGSGSSDPDNDTLSYYWDFGDGATAEGARVQHVYEKRGTYKVVLTVDDNAGSKCSTDSDSFVANVYQQPTSVIKVR